MNRELAYTTNPADVTKLAADIMNQTEAAAGGRSTYLRSLLAATQAELAGKPVLRLTGRAKRPDIDLTIQTYEKIQEAFYAAVLAAVPEGLKAAERQSKTSFARSAGATMRRAIRAGWNPLGTALHAVSKGGLAAWTEEHSEPRAVTPAGVEKRVNNYLERIGELLGKLPPPEAARIQALVLEQMGAEKPQRIVSSTLRKHSEVRPH
jgi:hypothetical protein